LEIAVVEARTTPLDFRAPVSVAAGGSRTASAADAIARRAARAIGFDAPHTCL
jgi:hypothetical protein